jgi:hypothetical protein
MSDQIKAGDKVRFNINAETPATGDVTRVWGGTDGRKYVSINHDASMYVRYMVRVCKAETPEPEYQQILLRPQTANLRPQTANRLIMIESVFSKIPSAGPELTSMTGTDAKILLAALAVWAPEAIKMIKELNLFIDDLFIRVSNEYHNRTGG